jgi:hypothetical protein
MHHNLIVYFVKIVKALEATVGAINDQRLFIRTQAVFSNSGVSLKRA